MRIGNTDGATKNPVARPSTTRVKALPAPKTTDPNTPPMNDATNPKRIGFRMISSRAPIRASGTLNASAPMIPGKLTNQAPATIIRAFSVRTFPKPMANILPPPLLPPDANPSVIPVVGGAGGIGGLLAKRGLVSGLSDG